MKDIVRFFWEQHKRAASMDAVNSILGKDTPTEWESMRWTDAYKATLSKSKQNQFDKEWAKYDKELEDYHNANPKQQNKLNPMRIPK